MFYPNSTQDVFYAYQRAIKELFDKVADATPFHTLSFGIPPSFKYNMNGGACNVHLMPYQGGTAVNVRYSIVQLAMARCGAHNKSMAGRVENILCVKSSELNIPVEVFLNNKPLVNASINVQSNVAVAPQTTPTCQPNQPQSAPQQTAQGVLPNFCSKCGTRFSEGARFCVKCGNKR